MRVGVSTCVCMCACQDWLSAEPIVSLCWSHVPVLTVSARLPEDRPPLPLPLPRRDVGVVLRLCCPAKGGKTIRPDPDIQFFLPASQRQAASTDGVRLDGWSVSFILKVPLSPRWR